MSQAFLLATPGRRPFTGHFRGKLVSGNVSLSWAGRLGSGGSPVEAWEAADAAREAMAAWPGAIDRTDALQQAWLCLHRLDPRWLLRQDLSVLFSAETAEGPLLSGSGLAMVFQRGPSGLRPLLSPDHPLLSEPGLAEAPPLFYAPSGPWYGQVHGTTLPTGEIDRLAGIRGSP